MTRPLSHLARDLQVRARDLQHRLTRLFDAPLDADATPLEISQAVVDDVERRLVAMGRGRRAFPYNRVIVRILQAHGDRAPLEAAFAGLPGRLRERLAELGCEFSTALDVKVHLLKKVPGGWQPGQLFAVEYQAAAEAAAAAPRSQSLHVTVIRGAAAKRAYSFAEPIVAIGRTADPMDGEGRGRRNRIAFLDTVDGVTETVGRVHAHLRFDAAAREYRLFDDGSSNGTSIVRNGTTIPVPARDPRGVRICSGDEVQIGRALLRIVLEPEPTTRQ